MRKGLRKIRKERNRPKEKKSKKKRNKKKDADNFLTVLNFFHSVAKENENLNKIKFLVEVK